MPRGRRKETVWCRSASVDVLREATKTIQYLLGDIATVFLLPLRMSARPIHRWRATFLPVCPPLPHHTPRPPFLDSNRLRCTSHSPSRLTTCPFSQGVLHRPASNGTPVLLPEPRPRCFSANRRQAAPGAAKGWLCTPFDLSLLIYSPP